LRLVDSADDPYRRRSLGDGSAHGPSETGFPEFWREKGLKNFLLPSGGSIILRASDKSLGFLAWGVFCLSGQFSATSEVSAFEVLESSDGWLTWERAFLRRPPPPGPLGFGKC